MARHEREIETKYDVDEATALPRLDALPGVGSTHGPEVCRLDATYFDTDDLALARRGITLRRRTGGADEGWHLKLPSSEGRYEIRLPLGRSMRTAPAELSSLVQDAARDAPVRPVGRVETERTTITLLDDEGALLAIFCDDRVTGARIGDGAGAPQAWREWEFEVHSAKRRLVKAALAGILEAGGRPATAWSKAGRVLGLEADGSGPTESENPVGSLEQTVLGRQLRSLVQDIHRGDPLARADVPDEVHQLRVRFRRLRSSLLTFKRCFEPHTVEPLCSESAWIGELLGRPRDLEVIAAGVGRLLREQPSALVSAAVSAAITDRLSEAHQRAHREALAAMSSDRYFALLDALDAWVCDPPWLEATEHPGPERLLDSWDRALSRLNKAARSASSASTGDHDLRLHEVRKASKRVRYSAEALTGMLDADARRKARTAERVQTTLGAHRDALLAADQVRHLAAAVPAEPEVAFVLGLLYAQLASEAELQAAAYEKTRPQTWRR